MVLLRGHSLLRAVHIDLLASFPLQVRPAHLVSQLIDCVVVGRVFVIGLVGVITHGQHVVSIHNHLAAARTQQQDSLRSPLSHTQTPLWLLQ